MSTKTYAPLDHFRLIAVSGKDALTFLQGQLTQDIVSMAHTQARFAGYCTAQGRVWATMLIWKNPVYAYDDTAPAVYIMIHKELALPLIKRLSLFVLRLKVTFDCLEKKAYAVWDEEQTCTHATDAFCVLDQFGMAIAFPCSENEKVSRHVLWSDMPPTHITLNPEPDAPARWVVQDIRSSLCWVHQRNQDQYIPQTLNLDLIHAISFTKGCYPGQEVVARTHYRGRVKRRMLLASVPSASVPALPLMGAQLDVFMTDEDPAGEVICWLQYQENVWLLIALILPESGLHPDMSIQIPSLSDHPAQCYVYPQLLNEPSAVLS